MVVVGVTKTGAVTVHESAISLQIGKLHLARLEPFLYAPLKLLETIPGQYYSSPEKPKSLEALGMVENDQMTTCTFPSS